MKKYYKQIQDEGMLPDDPNDPLLEDNMEYTAGHIEGVEIKDCKKFEDSRGWLSEFFRADEMPENQLPVMGYVSCTNVDVTRGPHEHVDQMDNFLFMCDEVGKKGFLLKLWDRRSDSPTYGKSMSILIGGLVLVKVPAGVVHAYKNVGVVPCMVFNFPNRLYKGFQKKNAVDEIRWEENPDSPFKV